MILLGESLGRAAAHKLMEEAVQRSVQENRKLTDVLAGISEVTNILPASEIQALDDPKAYLGAAEVFRKRLLDSID